MNEHGMKRLKRTVETAQFVRLTQIGADITTDLLKRGYTNKDVCTVLKAARGVNKLYAAKKRASQKAGR